MSYPIVTIISMVSGVIGFLLFGNVPWLNPFVGVLLLIAAPYFSAMAVVASFAKQRKNNGSK